MQESEVLKTSNKNKLDLIHDLRSHLKDTHSAAVKEFGKTVAVEISKIPQHHFSFLAVKEAIEITKKKLESELE